MAKSHIQTVFFFFVGLLFSLLPATACGPIFFGCPETTVVPVESGTYETRGEVTGATEDWTSHPELVQEELEVVLDRPGNKLTINSKDSDFSVTLR